MLESKLKKLFEDDKSFGTDSIGFDNGFMQNQHGDLVDYMILEYVDRFDVYLNLYDEGKPPYRNILAKASAATREEAQMLAVEELDRLAYSNDKIH